MEHSNDSSVRESAGLTDSGDERQDTVGATEGSIVAPDCDGRPRNSWASDVLEARHADGRKFADILILNCNPDASVDGVAPLGHDDVGVVVLEVADGDVGLQDTCIRWPVRLLFHRSAFGVYSVFDYEQKYFAMQAAVLANRRHEGKRKYESQSRARRLSSRVSKREALLSAESLLEAFNTDCCQRGCTRAFTPAVIRALRTEMHLQSFLVKSSKNVEVHKAIHSTSSGEKIVTLEGIAVCLEGWRVIHSVPRRTFYRYAQRARLHQRGSEHGNRGSLKGRSSTLQAVETLRSLLTSKADTMPHLHRTMPNGERVGLKVLPAGTRWKQFLDDVNEVNRSSGLRLISLSQLSKIRKKYFWDYVVKPRGDAFSRCGVCDNLQTLRASFAPNSEDHERIQKRFRTHLYMQEACRHAYYASRSVSILRPSQLLSIIHDKIDHSKTACPSYAQKTKTHDGLMKLPVSVAGILAHGHGDHKYAHYSLDVHPADSNFTVGSIAKVLRDLESCPQKSSRAMFEGSGTSPLYAALLVGKEKCLSSLGNVPSPLQEAQPLPPVLHVQMDNCWKDNKNRYVFCFWSLLVARRIFKEVVVSFMMVGHTHDDIDASFGRWSMRLREQDCLTLPCLMESYMSLEAVPFIPHLVEEVPDFKAFILPFIGPKLQGHSQGRQFKFTLKDDGWPIMQSKSSCLSKEWQPAEGIKLWRADSDGRAILPEGEPKAVKPHKMAMEAEVIRGIEGFIKHWETMLGENLNECHKARIQDCISYWSRVKGALEEAGEEDNVDDDAPTSLKNGFWPSTRQARDWRNDLMEDGRRGEEVEESEPYIGVMNGRPPPSYNVALDAGKDFYLFVRPAHESSDPVWLCRAVEAPQWDPMEPHFREVLVRWYLPCGASNDESQLYLNWDTKPNFLWKLDRRITTADYVSTDSIMASWKPWKEKKDGKVVAPRKQIKFAVDNLRRIAEREAMAS